ncbi:MAG: flagellar basal body P-ring formation chaperone FlgA [Rhodoblastus sp.]
MRGVCVSATAGAEEIVLPTPVATIYPGEIIRDGMLYDVAVDIRDGRNAVRTRGELIGRVAKRTLFIGKPIGVSAIDEPQTISNGSPVQIVYEQPGISISATGLALQSARAGDPIRVRNVETGLVVTGVVSVTGIVMVGR